MILGWSKVTRSEKKISEEKNLKDWTKWNRKMGGRSFNITSGAFGDTLMYSTQLSIEAYPNT